MLLLLFFITHSYFQKYFWHTIEVCIHLAIFSPLWKCSSVYSCFPQKPTHPRWRLNEARYAQLQRKLLAISKVDNGSYDVFTQVHGSLHTAHKSGSVCKTKKSAGKYDFYMGENTSLKEKAIYSKILWSCLPYITITNIFKVKRSNLTWWKCSNNQFSWHFQLKKNFTFSKVCALAKD